MTRPFTSVMPVRMVGQKHAEPKVSDNYGFLASLSGNQAADVNLQVVWRQIGVHTQAAGMTVFGLHGRTPAENGYTHIVRGKTCKPMTGAEKHRDLDHWTVADVLRWRRGPSVRSARPRTYLELVRYCKAHGGTVVGELKSRDFARYPFISDALVGVAKRCNHAAWYKALENMFGVEEKAQNILHAAGPGHFALIFGDHVKGAAARQRAGRDAMAGWSDELRAATRVW